MLSNGNIQIVLCDCRDFKSIPLSPRYITVKVRLLFYHISLYFTCCLILIFTLAKVSSNTKGKDKLLRGHCTMFSRNNFIMPPIAVVRLWLKGRFKPVYSDLSLVFLSAWECYQDGCWVVRLKVENITPKLQLHTALNFVTLSQDHMIIQQWCLDPLVFSKKPLVCVVGCWWWEQQSTSSKAAYVILGFTSNQPILCFLFFRKKWAFSQRTLEPSLTVLWQNWEAA